MVIHWYQYRGRGDEKLKPIFYIENINISREYQFTIECLLVQEDQKMYTLKKTCIGSGIFLLDFPFKTNILKTIFKSWPQSFVDLIEFNKTNDLDSTLH